MVCSKNTLGNKEHLNAQMQLQQDVLKLLCHSLRPSQRTLEEGAQSTRQQEQERWRRVEIADNIRLG